MTIKILKAMGKVTVINFQSLTLTIICTCSVAYLDPSEISMMELFARILKGLQPLTIFAKQLHHRYVAGF